MNSFSSYRQHLLNYLKKTSNQKQHQRVKFLKSQGTRVHKAIEFINLQKYNHDPFIKDTGYKVVRNVFSDTDGLLKKIEELDIKTLEFADKDMRLAKYINETILSDEKFIDLYRKIYGTDFLWQKVTIHRKKADIGLPLPDVERSTVEHVDLTETPNSKLTITAYIALTDQNSHSEARLLVYPGTHLLNLKIPMNNFDYLSNETMDLNVVKDLNRQVEDGLIEPWIRDSLFYIISGNNPRFDILRSTLMLLAYNPDLLNYKPKVVNLNTGDILFFTSNLLHGALLQKNIITERSSVAVRGGQPYHEKSNLISKCVSDDFYSLLDSSVPRDVFLFSGTSDMLSKFEPTNIIYNLDDIDI